MGFGLHVLPPPIARAFRNLTYTHHTTPPRLQQRAPSPYDIMMRGGGSIPPPGDDEEATVAAFEAAALDAALEAEKRILGRREARRARSVLLLSVCMYV